MKYAFALLLCMQTLVASQPQQDSASPTLSQQIIECFAQSVAQKTPAYENEQEIVQFSCSVPNQGYAQLTTDVYLAENPIYEEPVLLELEDKLVQYTIAQAFKAKYKQLIQEHPWVEPTEPFYILDECTKCKREKSTDGKDYLHCITYIKTAQYHEIMQQQLNAETQL